ncbi:Ig-like domain-containing protein [Neobacillus cucumis]|uniref:Ig-like domain-containing protein n=1 Tax=Neobacillus cucumis TaxID=1740721 RepID=UPI002E225B21|nr:Ig-like domain-containing protein [Neobacillus cucumis]
MKALKTFFCSFVVVCLFAILPSVAFGETTAKQIKPVGEPTGQPFKSFGKSMITTAPKSPLIKSKVQTQSYTSPGDYKLVTNGQFVDYLYDSWDTIHTITFGSVSSYTTDLMDIQVTDSTDYYYLKDAITSIEFYKNNGGTLAYAGYTQFDTSGYQTVNLHSYVSKSTFSDQPYIYMRLGVADSIYDTYYSDTTLFQVKNPYYVPADTTPPANPIVKAVSDKDTTISGTAEANSTVYAKLGTSTIGSGKANSSGSFSISISPQKAGTTLTFYAQDAAGNKSGNVTVTVTDKTPPVKPTVNSVGDNQTIVTGNTEANATVTIKVGSTVLASGAANSSGYFTLKLTAVQKAGTTLTVYATDKAGNQSSTNLTVLDKTPPAAPTVNKVTYSSTSVTGTGEKGSKIYIYRGTTLLGTATVDTYGKFTVAITKQTKGAQLEVIAMDNAYNQSKSVFVTVY